MIMKFVLFWDVTPCSLIRCQRRFKGTCWPNLQGLIPG